MTDEQDKNITSDELITALREEYEKKLKDREAELRQEFEAKQIQFVKELINKANSMTIKINHAQKR